jgi:hypothetical protein
MWPTHSEVPVDQEERDRYKACREKRKRSADSVQRRIGCAVGKCRACDHASDQKQEDADDVGWVLRRRTRHQHSQYRIGSSEDRQDGGQIQGRRQHEGNAIGDRRDIMRPVPHSNERSVDQVTKMPSNGAIKDLQPYPL